MRAVSSSADRPTVSQQSTQNGNPPRTIGRPRRQPRDAVGDPTDDILAAAGRSFGDVGFAATSMARIAIEAGLGQSSLYYYFHSKDEILAALVSRANVVPLQLLDRIEADGGPAAVRLFRFVRGDVLALCRLGFDINEVHRQAAADPERFGTYWRERRLLLRRISAIVRDGIADGAFRRIDARLTAITVMSNDEAVQHWFRISHEVDRSPERAAVFLAELTIAGLLLDPTSIEAVRRSAGVLDRRGGL